MEIGLERRFQEQRVVNVSEQRELKPDEAKERVDTEGQLIQETERKEMLAQKVESERVMRDEIISDQGGSNRGDREYVDMQTSAYMEQMDNCFAEVGRAPTKYVMNRSVQLDPHAFQQDNEVQCSHVSLPSHHSSQEENWAEAPSDRSMREMDDFFRENRQIKDLELLKTGTDKTMINKYNEVIVSPFYNSFASKYRKDDM